MFLQLGREADQRAFSATDVEFRDDEIYLRQSP
jgi:hypothetical protein